MSKLLRRTGYALAALIAVGFLPPVQARVKAVPVLAESLGFQLPRPFAASVERTEVVLDGVTGDLYSPKKPAPAIVLIPGAAPKGRDDPRLIRAAEAVTKTERIVFVPQLELTQRRFVVEDIERIVRSTAALGEREDVVGEVTLFGISYGGSFALIAAADDRLQGRLGQIAVFGAYFDLVGVVQAVTTGVSLVDGETIPFDPDPRARDVLNEVATRLVPQRARSALTAALEGDVDRSRLPQGARIVYDFLTNEEPERTFDLADRLPERARRVIEEFSPSSVAGRIDAPVVAMHSTDDPVVPYGEGVRLESGLSDTRLYSVSFFRHVDLSEGEIKGGFLGATGDFFTAWRFTSAVLSAQE
ncbi:MAG: alpha/beta hydrolase family protein [Actinomycetota bacterium]